MNLLSNYRIREATRDDYTALKTFVDSAHFVYHHLDWCPVFDWLGTQPFLILENEDGFLGLLACPVDSTGVAWIRLFSANSNFTQANRIWNLLFEAAYLELSTDGKPYLAALGLQEWLVDVLRTNHFRIHQNIVVLEWDRHLPTQLSLPPGVSIRRMGLNDLYQVQQVDAQAFEPLWQNTFESLSMAYDQSPFATVIMENAEIVGYQICTSTQFGIHLARLAVLPSVQRRHYGYTLVCNLLSFFNAEEMKTITVNTQHDNIPSLALYRKAGFRLTMESFPVFIFP
jgi:ribosomal protein S18 acetylase RimI-like enzyme